MKPITVTCDRCHQRIEGCMSEEGLTGGFYQIDPTRLQEGWAAYSNPGERIVCDACMWRDPRYQAVFGTISSYQDLGAIQS